MWEWEGSRCCGRPALASDCLTTPCWDAGAARPGNEFLLPGTPARRSSRPRAPSSAAFVFGGGLVWSGGGGLRVAGSRRWWSLKHKGEERGRSHRDMIFFFCLFVSSVCMATITAELGKVSWREKFKYIQRSFAQFLRVSHDATLTHPEHLRTSKILGFTLWKCSVSIVSLMWYETNVVKNLPFVMSQKALKGITWEFESVFSVKQHLNWKKRLFHC